MVDENNIEVENLSREEIEELILSSSTSSETLMALAKSDEIDWGLSVELAGRHDLTSEILNVLADHDDDSIRWAVAENESVPLSILLTLLEDEDEEVCQAVLENETYLSHLRESENRTVSNYRESISSEVNANDLDINLS
ncbi:MAG: hypothetical protein IBX55_00505 [Methyloprofundus sp.]|nr:hypothetical protein [Methyloprofundus sp.]